MILSDEQLRKIKTGVKFGPFRTPHYQNTVDATFRTVFIAFLVQEVVPKLTISFDKMKGKVGSRHDHPRFLGPNSACKYKFSFDGKFFQGPLRETVTLDFIYKHNIQTIQPVFGGLHVFTVQEQQKLDHHSKQTDEILRLIRAGERKIACPNCATQLDLMFLEYRKKDYVKLITCPTGNCLYIRFYGLGAGPPGKLDHLEQAVLEPLVKIYNFLSQTFRF